jgi:hypothetical protein
MNISGRLIGLILICAIISVAGAQEARQWAVKAYQAYGYQEYAKCAQYYGLAIDRGATHYETFYNAACCFALILDVEQAYADLEEAMDRGYYDAENLENDSDLEILHGDERWIDIVVLCHKNLNAYLATINAELYWMYQEDQQSRMNDEIDWEIVHKQDSTHRARVKEIIDAGGLRAADDYFHAAMIYQHGDDSTDYRMAHELALKAVEVDSTHDVAKWLSAAAMDRYLWSVDKPQIYGTQYHIIDGKWTIEPIDTTAVTDDERQKWHVPTLEEARKRAEGINE